MTIHVPASQSSLNALTTLTFYLSNKGQWRERDRERERAILRENIKGEKKWVHESRMVNFPKGRGGKSLFPLSDWAPRLQLTEMTAVDTHIITHTHIHTEPPAAVSFNYSELFTNIKTSFPDIKIISPLIFSFVSLVRFLFLSSCGSKSVTTHICDKLAVN